jgi:hypothetical protein
MRSMTAMDVELVMPDRVYVRLEQCGLLRLSVWGMEHDGLRSEVVEPVVAARQSAAGRAAAVSGIERDLRRGVGLAR